MMTLEEATTTQLIRELDKRCPSLVIAMHVPQDKNQVETRTFISGNRASCLGLAHIAVFRCEAALGLRSDLDDEDIEDDDDTDDADDETPSNAH